MCGKFLRNEARIELNTLAAEMNAVVLEQLRPVGARAVPVDQRRIAITVHTIGDHLVVRFLPAPRHLDVYENDDAPVRQRLHHGVELIRRERTVIADVNDDGVAQRLRASSLLQDIQRRLRLAPDRCVDVGAGDSGGEGRRGSNHHRIAEHRHSNVRRDPINLRRTVARPSGRVARWHRNYRALIGRCTHPHGGRHATLHLRPRRRDYPHRFHRKVLWRGWGFRRHRENSEHDGARRGCAQRCSPARAVGPAPETSSVAECPPRPAERAGPHRPLDEPVGNLGKHERDSQP